MEGGKLSSSSRWVSSSPLLNLRLLRDVGHKYRPDLVVYSLDMTDFRDDLHYEHALEAGDELLEDCEVACTFDAIRMNANGLPVVSEALCTACGDCVEICPRDLFSLHPVSHQLWVACKSIEQGEQAEADCRVLCTGCGRCAADAPEGLIRIERNLAVIDYSKNALASRLAVERCPTGAIVWLEDDVGGAYRGREAKRIVRKGVLPVG